MADLTPEALDALENLLNAVWLDEDNGVLCHRALAAIRALRAAPVAMREGELAYAALSFCDDMHRLGLSTAFGLGDDEDLDLCGLM
jgi:hypothetical protein